MEDKVHRFQAIKVQQPIGTFYVVSLKASFLLDVCYSVEAKLKLADDVEKPKWAFWEKDLQIKNIEGSQRPIQSKRLEEIRKYSEEINSTFPNSIILGANYREDGTYEKDEAKQWKVEVDSSTGCLYLEIPDSDLSLASIIDGQHRLYGLEDSKNVDMDLICSVFLELPVPFHADIFTKINMNQKPVNKNTIYNLFQFDMQQGDISTWSPETFAVYFARVLQEEAGSPLKGKMKLGISNSEATTTISMASIVDGILSLISSKPSEDRSLMNGKRLKDRKRELLRNIRRDSSCLRSEYINGEDKTIFDIVYGFFVAVEKYIWNKSQNTVFYRTIGITALFDYLKEIIKRNPEEHFEGEFFDQFFERIDCVNFEDGYFKELGKSHKRIKESLFVLGGLKAPDEVMFINEKEKEKFLTVVSEV